MHLQAGFESISKRTEGPTDDKQFFRYSSAYRRFPSRLACPRTNPRLERPVAADELHRTNASRKMPETRLVRGYIQKVADDLFVREDPTRRTQIAMSPFVEESQQRRTETSMEYNEKVWKWLDKLSVPVHDVNKVASDSRKRRWVLPYPSTASDTMSDTSSEAGKEQKRCRGKTRAVIGAYRTEAEGVTAVRGHVPTHELSSLSIVPSASKDMPSLSTNHVQYYKYKQ